MRKLWILLPLILILQNNLFAQLAGDGSSSNPFRGSITTNEVWDFSEFTNGIVYVGLGGRNPVYDLTVSSGGSLIINGGITVIFKETPSDLIITGTGRLTINGSVSAKVTLTRLAAKPNWGHITFENTSVSSSIQNCIIEYGSGGVNGGGLNINTATSPITIRNTTIRNCNATYGGGIEIVDSNPIIENCIIHNNIGAGIDIYGGSTSIINCTIANNNNTNDSEYGCIHVSLGSAVIKNCILWNNSSGSTNEMDYSGGGTISYSATSQTVSGTGMIDLSLNNIDPTGPNFTNISNDFSLNFTSPCRDAGTAAGATANDINGKARISNPDIGAYEVQYSRWSGSSSSNWETTGNWVNGVLPSVSQIAVIPDVTTNPVISSGDATLTRLIVEAGGNLTIGPSRLLTATNLTINASGNITFAPNAKGSIINIINNGSLLLESEASGSSTSGISSLITTTFTGNNPTIELYLPAQYHYISSPFTTMSAKTEIIDEPNSSAVMEYRENLITNDMNNGWVTTSGNHYNVLTKAWELHSAWSWTEMDEGHGYNYYSDAAYTYNISGPINLSNQDVTLVYNTAGLTTPNTIQQGYNLLGNPFTSSIDWDDVVAFNTSLFPDNVATAIYFRQGGSTIVYNNGITSPGSVNSDGSLIPPMQGFFLKSNVPTATLTIPASARIHSANKRYKGLSSGIPLIRLQLENSGNTDETVIRFDEKATLSFDNSFDAYKIFPAENKPSVSSVTNSAEYSINGIPFPESHTSLPLFINAPVTGSYTVNATELLELSSYKVYLKDNLLGTKTNLHENPVYTFTTATGKIQDRFVLEVATLMTAIPETPVLEKPFNIFFREMMINIQTLGDEWDGQEGDIRIIDMRGKVLGVKENIYFDKGDMTSIPFTSQKGIYFVEVKSGIRRYVGKAIVN